MGNEHTPGDSDYDYATQLERAENKLFQLESAKDRIDREIAGIKHVIEGLKFLAEKSELDAPPVLGPDEAPPDFEDSSFVSQVQETLSRNREPMTPVEIRDRLQEKGIQGTTPKHLLISVHTVIRRLLEKKLLIPIITDRGKAYRIPTALDRFHKRVQEAQKEAAPILSVKKGLG